MFKSGNFRLTMTMKKLRSSVLFRNLMTVASGSAIGQFIAFAFSPLITRIYSPESFGVQGIFLSLISIFSPLIALRYPLAIISARKASTVPVLARLSLFIAIGMACILQLLLALLSGPISKLFGADSLGQLIHFLPLALFCIALQDITGFQAARLGIFRLVATATIAKIFLTNFARVVCGLFAPVAATLVIVTSLAPLVESWILQSKLSDTSKSRRRIGRAKLFAALRRYRDFPIFRAPTDILYAASEAIPLILLGTFFSSTVAGFYALTRSVLNLPVNVIGGAIGNVIYARFAELAREHRPVTPLAVRMTLALLLPAPLLIGLAQFAPLAFSVFFGKEWEESGQYAQWMSIWIAFAIASIPSVRLSPVIYQQHRLLIVNFLQMIIKILSIVFSAILYKDPMTSVIWFSVASLILNIILIVAMILPALAYDRQNCVTRAA